MRRMYTKNQITQIADQEVKSLVEGGTLNNAKPIYKHIIRFARQSDSVYYIEGYAEILNNSSNPITKADFLQLLLTPDEAFIISAGLLELTVGAEQPAATSCPVTLIENYSNNFILIYYRSDSNVETTTTITIEESQWTIVEVGNHKIN